MAEIRSCLALEGLTDKQKVTINYISAIFNNDAIKNDDIKSYTEALQALDYERLSFFSNLTQNFERKKSGSGMLYNVAQFLNDLEDEDAIKVLSIIANNPEKYKSYILNSFNQVKNRYLVAFPEDFESNNTSNYQVPIVMFATNILVGNVYEATKKTVQQIQDEQISNPEEVTTDDFKYDNNIIETDKEWSREDVEQDKNSLYIFNDNTNRNSGKGTVDKNSIYYKNYGPKDGSDLYYPSKSSAVIRGLNNAFPISTQRFYNKFQKGENGRWTDSEIEEFKTVIDSEIDNIIDAFKSDNYTRIVLPKGGIFDRKISKINAQRTPQLYSYLQSALKRLSAEVSSIVEQRNAERIKTAKPKGSYWVMQKGESINSDTINNNSNAYLLYNNDSVITDSNKERVKSITFNTEKITEHTDKDFENSEIRKKWDNYINSIINPLIDYSKRTGQYIYVPSNVKDAILKDFEKAPNVGNYIISQIEERVLGVKKKEKTAEELKLEEIYKNQMISKKKTLINNLLENTYNKAAFDKRGAEVANLLRASNTYVNPYADDSHRFDSSAFMFNGVNLAGISTKEGAEPAFDFMLSILSQYTTALHNQTYPVNGKDVKLSTNPQFKTAVYKTVPTEESVGLLWLPPKSSFMQLAKGNTEEERLQDAEKQYQKALENVINGAVEILSKGGIVKTISINQLLGIGDTSRREESTKDIIKALKDRGYYMTSKDYLSTFTVAKPLDKEAADYEEQRKKQEDLLKKQKELADRLATITPDITVDGERVTIILPNQDYNDMSALSNTDLHNGFAVDKTSEIYQKLEELVDKGDIKEGSVVQIPLGGLSVFGKVDSIYKNDRDITLVGLFRKYQSVERNAEFNSDTFDAFNILDDKIDLPENARIIMGVERADECVNIISNSLIEAVRNRTKREEEDLQKAIDEVYATADADKTRKRSKKGYAILTKEEKDTVKKLSRELSKFRKDPYVSYLQKYGFESAKNDIREAFEEYSDKDGEYKEDIIEEIIEDSNKFSDGLSDEAVEEWYDKFRAVSNDILTHFDSLWNMSLDTIAENLGIKISYVAGVGQVYKTDKEDLGMYESEVDNGSEDENQSVDNEEGAHLENYQFERLDVKKSTSKRIKDLFRKVTIPNDNPNTGYVERNSMMQPIYMDSDEVYNTLLELLSNTSTLKEMYEKIDTFAANGRPEFYTIYDILKQQPQDFQNEFFVAMYNQDVKAITSLNREDVNRIVDENKDFRYERLKNLLNTTIVSRTPLVEDLEYDFVSLDGINKIHAKALQLLKKLSDNQTTLKGLDSYKIYAKKKEEKVNKKDLIKLDLFKSNDQKDIDFIQDSKKLFLNIIHGLGISITDSQFGKIFNSVSNYNNVYKTLKRILKELSTKRGINILHYGSLYSQYNDLLKLLSTALTEIPQKYNIHVGKNDYALYRKPSYSSILLNELNRFDEYAENPYARRKKFIEERFKKYKIFYKSSNLDEIRPALEKHLQNLKKEVSTSNDSNLKTQIDTLQRLLNDWDVAFRVGAYNSLKKQNREKQPTQSEIEEEAIKIVASLLKDVRNILPSSIPPLKGVIFIDSNVIVTGIWRNKWLQSLYEECFTSSTTRDAATKKWRRLSTETLITANKKEYKDLTPAEYQQFMLDAFCTKRNQNNNYGSFSQPVLSDVETGLQMVFELPCKNVETIESDTANYFVEVVKAETEMIDALYEAYNNRVKAFEKFNKKLEEYKKQGKTIDFKLEDPEFGYTHEEKNFDIETYGVIYNSDGTINIENSKKIKNYRGAQYHYIKYDASSSKDVYTQCLEQLNKEYTKWLNTLDYNTTIPVPSKGSDKAVNIKVYSKPDDSSQQAKADNEVNLELNGTKDSKINTSVNPEAEPYLKLYFYNSAYANYMMHQLFFTTPATYKDTVDFFKRSKEYNVPMQRLCLDDSNRYEKVVYFSDIIRSTFDDVVDSTKHALIDIIDDNPHATEDEKSRIKTAFSKNNVTDAQALRSAKSYIKIQKALGGWTEEHEKAWRRLSDPKQAVRISDLEFLVLGTKKPYYYGMEEITIGNNYKMPRGVQHKNSEFCLLYHIMSVRGYQNPMMEKLEYWMDENGIDMVEFDSAVKVGAVGSINLNGVTSPDELYNKLNKAIRYSDGSINPQVVHTLDLANYGIVSETPEHFMDEEAKFGTQIRKLFYGDLDFDHIYIWKGKPTKGKVLWDRYNQLIHDNLKDAFEEVRELFSNPKELESFLLEEVTGNPLYPADMVDMVRMVDGKFPKLVNPKNSLKIEQLLLSIFKKRITSQKIAGGSCVQVSSVFCNDLKIQYEKREAIENGKKVLKKVPVAAEVYLPLYLKELYEEVLDDDGCVDMSKINDLYDDNILEEKATKDALLNMIGYRIPTEGLSSTLKLKVKGFMPNYNGSSIILPKEITTLSGSDFDIDKMYIHRFEFKTSGGKPMLITFSNAETKEEIIAARNNELVDMMMNFMTLPENRYYMIRPQGFAELERSSYEVLLLQNGFNYSDIRKMSYEEVKEAAKKYDSDNQASLLSPITQIMFQQQNMVGKNLLGIWAVAKSSHFLFQRSGLRIKPEYQFKINNILIDNPGAIETSITDSNGTIIKQRISTNIGSYLGSAADNAKNPLLYKLGINKTNINMASTLVRLGFDSTSVSLLLQHPYFDPYIKNEIFEEFKLYYISKLDKRPQDFNSEDEYNDYVEEAIRNSKEFKSLQDFAKGFNTSTFNYTPDLFAFYFEQKDRAGKEGYDKTFKYFNIYKDENGKDRIENITLDWFKVQYAIASLAASIKPISDRIQECTMALRADSINGAVKTNMAETVSYIQQIKAAHRHLVQKTKDNPFTTNDGTFFSIEDESFYRNIDNYEHLSNPTATNIGMVQDFLSYGILSARQLTRNILPHWCPTFYKAFKLGEYTRNGYMQPNHAKKFTSVLYYYHLLSLPFFGEEKVIINGVKTTLEASGKIKYYRDNMIDLYYDILTKNIDLQDNLFVKCLHPDGALSEEDKQNGKIRTLRMPNTNSFSREFKTKLQSEFLRLAQDDRKEVRRFAWHLLRYGFYRQGFRYLPDGYMHLIPNEMLDMIPGYAERCNKLLDKNPETALSNGTFIKQYILKNPDFALTLPTLSYGKFKEGMWNKAQDVYKSFGEIKPFLTVRFTDFETKKPCFKLATLGKDGNYHLGKKVEIKEPQEYFLSFDFPSIKSTELNFNFVDDFIKDIDMSEVNNSDGISTQDEQVIENAYDYMADTFDSIEERMADEEETTLSDNIADVDEFLEECNNN